MPADRPLTPTSFAILGLLALRPWPTYELAKQIGLSLSHLWPRAESNLYAEAKRLVSGGHATARHERTGKRRRTIYAITPRGRQALRAWLSQTSGAMHLESEALLRVFYADQGSKADLLATIRAIGREAEQKMALLQQLALVYRAGGGAFPERLPVNVVAIGLIWQQLETTLAWSRRAAKAVQGWRGVGANEPPPWPPGIFDFQSSAEFAKRGG